VSRKSSRRLVACTRLFESQQTTVAGWIRHRRLERCRRDCSIPANATVLTGTSR
jgi:hypothetical protein